MSDSPTPVLIDTHCHLTYDELATDIRGVLARAAEAGVGRLITIATDVSDARRAIELLDEFPQVSMAAGIHPHQAAKVNDEHLQALADLHHGAWSLPFGIERVVAIGECGLDFHYDFAPKDTQERVFRAQLDLAIACLRPVIIHARKSEDAVIAILRDYPALGGRVVFHCFSGDRKMARRALDDHHWLSFTGVVTFKNGAEVLDAATYAPIERVMVETDAPYLTPEPHRRHFPNEPRFVAETARKLAHARKMTLDEFAAATTANAERFFSFGKAKE
ncbi:MAG: TatD family hydrolase [Phycisphaerales bacterium]|nr:TatD family hydrolase [Phycisphaerales bacterium]